MCKATFWWPLRPELVLCSSTQIPASFISQLLSLFVFLFLFGFFASGKQPSTPFRTSLDLVSVNTGRSLASSADRCDLPPDRSCKEHGQALGRPRLRAGICRRGDVGLGTVPKLGSVVA